MNARLVILDEAVGPAPTVAMLDALMRDPKARILLIGSPDRPCTDFGPIWPIWEKVKP